MPVMTLSSNIVIVFGKPGAGKTTIAERTRAIYLEKVGGSSCSCLDLDICVPQWMKDNFSNGQYPTLEERKEFAIGACDYVDEQLEILRSSHDQADIDNVSSPDSSHSGTSNHVLISFSFVNCDLRVVLRARLPQAKWALIDTSDETAQERINQREGHFYKGVSSDEDAERSSSNQEKLEEKNVDKKVSEEDSSDWDFAPVDYDHSILDGSKPVDFNAIQIFESLYEIERI